MRRKICKKCGGSLMGKEFNTYCAHEFDEPPEPETELFCIAPNEVGWSARICFEGGPRMSFCHPLKDGAIEAAKTWWWQKFDQKQLAEKQRKDIQEKLEHNRGIAKAAVSPETEKLDRGALRQKALEKHAKSRVRLADIPRKSPEGKNGRVGQVWVRDGNTIILLSYVFRGLREGWWSTTTGVDVHDSQLGDLWRRADQDQAEAAWMRLTVSTEAQDRKIVTNMLRNLGYQASDFMPMSAERRVEAIMEGCHY